MANQTLWVGFAQNTIGLSNSATGDPSPSYLVHEVGAGTVTFTPRNPVTAVTGVDVKQMANRISMGWTSAAVGTNGMSITDPGTLTGTFFYYAVSVTRAGVGSDTLDPLWQQD
jgi:hypothetical protein